MSKNIRVKRRMLSATAISVALAVLPQPAIAQVMESAGTSSDAGVRADIGDTAEATGGEIVVTAQRRTEKLRDVPISVTAISTSQLEQANVQSLADIAEVTPALRFDNVGTFVQPTIRGVGTSFATSGGLGNVGIYVDGFYAPNPLGTDFQLVNTQSIQVLKGPQGTLFGRNTTGGAILVSTAQPSVVPKASAEIAYSSFNTKRAQAYVTGGVTDTIAVDIEGLYRSGDGFVTNILSGNDKVGAYENWTVRAGVKFDISANASILARYIRSETDDPTANLANAYSLDGRPLTAALNPALIFGVPDFGIPSFGTPVVTTDPDEVANARRMSFEAQADIFQLTGELDLGFANLTSYTQYRDESSFGISDLDYSSSPLYALGLPNTSSTFTQELLLASAPGTALQWTAGLFYFNFRDSYPGTQGALFGGPLATFARSSTRTKSIAGFIDATYEMTPRLFVTAGIRVSRDSVVDSYFSDPGPDGSLIQRDVEPLKSTKATPRVVLRYKPDDSSSIYASYTLGYKPGLLNVGGGSLEGIRIKPEKISAFEAGYKYGSGPLSFDIAGYYYDYTDLQVSGFTGTQSLLTNAATARIYGFEAQSQYSVSSRFSVNAAVAYTNARYRDFETSPFYDLNGAVLFDNGALDASGFKMQRAPDFTANLGARYVLNVAGGDLALSGSLYYSSSFYFDSSNQFRQGGYETLALRAEWTDPSERLSIAVFGDNVTDSRYRTQVLPSNFGIGTQWSYPATVGVSLGFDY